MRGLMFIVRGHLPSFSSFSQYSFGADPLKTLLEPLEEELSKTTHTYCGKNHQLFTKRLSRSLEGMSWKLSRGRWQKSSPETIAVEEIIPKMGIYRHLSQNVNPHSTAAGAARCGLVSNYCCKRIQRVALDFPYWRGFFFFGALMKRRRSFSIRSVPVRR